MQDEQQPSTAPLRAAPLQRSAVRSADVLKVLTIIALFAGGCYLLVLLGPFILTVVVAMLLAVAADPAVRFIQRRGIGRAPAVLIFTGVLVLLLGLLIAAFVPPLVSQGRELANDAPSYVEQLQEKPIVRSLDERFDIIDKGRAQASSLPPRVGGNLAVAAGVVFASIASAVTVLFLMVLLLLGGRDIVFGVVQVFPKVAERKWWNLVQDSYRSISGYVAGTLVIAVIAGMVVLVMCLILGLPAFLPLALWMSLLDVVPLVGALVGAVPAIVVAFAAGGVVEGIVMTAVLVAYQQVENIVLQPAILGRVVALAPVVVFIVILAGAQLLGIVGALLAIPIAGIGQIFLRSWLEERNGAGGSGTSPPPIAPNDVPDAPVPAS